MPTRTKTKERAFLGFHTDPELKQRLLHLAKKENRSLARQAEEAMRVGLIELEAHSK